MNYIYIYAERLSCVWPFTTLWTVACQAPLSMRFFSKNTGLGTISTSRGFSQPMDWAGDSCVFFTAGRLSAEPSGKLYVCVHVCACVCVCVYNYSFYMIFYCCCCSVAQSCLTFWNSMGCSTSGLPVLHHFSELVQTHVHWVNDANQPSHPLSPVLLLPSILPGIRVFSHELALHTRWPKYWSFSFRISPSNEYSGLIFFRIDWFDPLAVQGTLKSLLQHRSLKASILQCSAFFMVQLSHPYMTTGKK